MIVVASVELFVELVVVLAVFIIVLELVVLDQGVVVRELFFLVTEVFGFIVGLTSVGSGTYFGLMMVLVYPLTMPRIVGTDIFHAAALLWVAGVGHLIIGDVDLHATAWLLVGSVPGILISSRYTVKVPDMTIRGGLGGILIISGLKLLNVPEANWVLGGGLLVLLVVLTIYTVNVMLNESRAAHEAHATTPERA